MSKKNLALLLVIIPIILIATGCLPKCQPEDYSSFDIILDGPADGSTLIPPGPPTFSWHHNEECRPESFSLAITRAEDNSHIFYYTSGKNDSLTADFILYPARRYYWHIAPYNLEGWITGKSSETRYFETEGFCSESELVAPILLNPSNADLISSNNSIQFQWEHPGDCEPRYYSYQFAADPDFENIIFSGLTENKYKSAYFWFPDCTRVYWRIAARSGSASSPYSEPFKFTKAIDNSCWLNQSPEDAALIRGYVWEDICISTAPYVPDGVGLTAPCIFSQQYGVYANGVRARGENGESGISEVIVDLGSGPCPSVGLYQTVTTENGMYYFLVQSPGEYCISLDKASNPELANGIWTYPLTDQAVTGQTVTFGNGDNHYLQSFGWDEYDIFRVNFEVLQQAFCRFGPSIKFHAEATTEVGQILPILGLDQEKKWLLTRIDGKECFLYIGVGQPDGPLGAIPLAEPVPDPTPAPSTNCSQYTTQETCKNADCTWNIVAGAPSFCSN